MKTLSQSVISFIVGLVAFVVCLGIYNLAAGNIAISMSFSEAMGLVLVIGGIGIAVCLSYFDKRAVR